MKKILLALAIICVGLHAQFDEDIFTNTALSDDTDDETLIYTPAVHIIYPQNSDEAYPKSYKFFPTSGSRMAISYDLSEPTEQELKNRLQVINRKKELAPVLKQEKKEIENELKRRKNK